MQFMNSPLHLTLLRQCNIFHPEHQALPKELSSPTPQENLPLCKYEKLSYSSLFTSVDFSLTKVFAIYDCCRVPLEHIKELNKLYVGKGIEVVVDDFAATVVRYTHIQACGPGGIAEADGGFAKRFHDFAE